MVTVCPGASPVYGVSHRDVSALHQPTRPEVLCPPGPIEGPVPDNQ